MVRLLKVKELEDRKRFLLAQSEMYRQTMTLEIANVKFSAALAGHKLRSKRNIAMLIGTAVPLAGFLFVRSRAKRVVGVLPHVVAGLKVVGKLMPLIRTFQSVKNRIGQRRNLTHHP